MAMAGIQFKPVGIFWDIENCSVPKGKSASNVIAHIRNLFVFNRLNHREYEFLIACDVARIRKDVPDDVNKAGGVTLAHVSGSSKNAADEKLRENMKRFVDTHSATNCPTLVLVSSDIDFVNDLRGYQMRMGCTIILVHASQCSAQFKVGWNEIYNFQDFCAAVPFNPSLNGIGAGPPDTKGTDPKKVATQKSGPQGKQQQQGQPGSGPKQQQGQPGQNQQPAPAQNGPKQSGPKQQGPKQQEQLGPKQQQGQSGPKGQFAVNQQGQPGTKQHGPPGPKQQEQLGPRQQGQHGQPGPKQQGQSGLNQQGQPGPKQQQGQAGPGPKQQQGQGPKQQGQGQAQANETSDNQQQQTKKFPKQKKPAGEGAQSPNAYNQQGQGPSPAYKGPGLRSGPQAHNFGPQGEPSVGPIIGGISQMNIKDQKPNTPKFILMVAGLPGKMDFHILKDHLQEQANSVFGKVKYVKNGQAFITFTNKGNADRAVQLFNGIEVYGKKLNVSFTQNIPFENPMDKKFKGGSAPQNFVMVNHGDIPPGGAGPRKFKKQKSGGDGDNQTQLANYQTHSSSPPEQKPSWHESVMSDPRFVGQLGAFAGAVIRECTLNNSGPTTSDRRVQNDGSSDKNQEKCSIQ